jgi:NTE family protein
VGALVCVKLFFCHGAEERESKDYEFSRVSVLERWEAGRRDMQDTINHPDWLKQAGRESGAMQYDLTRHSRQLNPLAL